MIGAKTLIDLLRIIDKGQQKGRGGLDQQNNLIQKNKTDLFFWVSKRLV